eukprot:CAMPEP_0194218658 /NCGR_PEP_ID=MMETSP0156-20130528/24313_1 /TAXON_ID=33649 /ORGANISM="Thalassionema nitzschioides, Strain L26-B" /LENGTH=1129 /DNA_ID=CAMNT_0038948105 /DNA_START=84 /DNA_END=3473 /DNA_ORIENTATION=-
MSSLFGAFVRPVGAAADVKELEYIAAIHQTGKLIDEGAFITAQDVSVFLRSKFGIKIQKEDAIDIVRGLSGSTRLPLPEEANNSEGKQEKNEEENEDNTSEAGEEKPNIKAGLGSGDDIELAYVDPAIEKNNNLEIDEKSDDDESDNDKSDDDEEQHYAEILQDVADVRRHWKFKRDIPKKKKEKIQDTQLLVKYDIVQLMTFLYIPTLLRLKHTRLNNSVPFASASFYGVQLCIDYLLPSKWVSLFVQWKENKYKKMKQELLPKPQTLIRDVLTILLRSLRDDGKLRNEVDVVSITDDDDVNAETCIPQLSQKITVSEHLVRSMLVRIGEKRSALDDELVSSMVEAAGGEGALLNELSFARALTADVEAWPLECEDNKTTSFYDVYGFTENECIKQRKKKTKEERKVVRDTGDDLEGAQNHENLPSRIPRYKNTLSYIDYAADTFQSTMFVIFLFTFYTISAIFLVFVLNDRVKDSDCNGDFLCLLGKTIIDWLIFAAVLIASGFIIILPISLGNNAHSLRILPSLFSIALLVVYIYLSDLALDTMTGNSLNMEQNYMMLLWTAMTVAACLTLFTLLKNLLATLTPDKLRKNMFLKQIMLSSNTLRTAKQKKAATNKINLMIENAYQLHLNAEKSLLDGANAEHQTILNFVVNGEKQVRCGGLIWTWKGLLKKTIFSDEGVWFHARLMIAQTMQVIVSVLIGIFWYEGTFALADKVEKDRLKAEEEGNKFALGLIPTRGAIVYPFMIGGIITLSFMLLLILVYVPTTAAMVLKFRSGVLPSLHDPYFKRFRKCPDAIYFNSGNMIYGLVGSSSLFFFIFAGLLFLVAWEPTRPAMIAVIGWGLGLTITVVLKMLITGCFRSRNHKGLYRTRPGAANLSSLALECWHLGLAGGVLLGRLTQFLLAMAFWIGRIDSVLLSDEVDMLGYRFDTVPHKFVTEILVHDAHRHPYIERMGAMYLMRYKYGENFSSDAGAAWRRIFISTLFPWVLKYKEHVEENIEDDQLLKKEEESAKRREAKAKLDVFRSSLFTKVEEHEEELHKMEEGQEYVAVFKKELLDLVDEHLKDVSEREAEEAQLVVLKDKLIAKVDEHLEDIHKAEDKAAVTAKLKTELMDKVDTHARTIGLRASF